MIILFGCCNNDPINNPPIVDPAKDVFEIMWSTRLDDSKEIVNLANGQVFQDLFLYPGDGEDPFEIKMYNTENGDSQGTILNSAGKVNDEIDIAKVVGNIYIAITNRGIVGVNIETKNVIWEVDYINNGWSRRKGSNFNDGYLYVAIQEYINANNWIDHMLKVDYQNGEYEIVYTIQPEGDYSPHMSPPAFWTNPDNGFKLMCFSNGWDDLGAPQGQPTDFLAVDLNTKEILWKAEEFCEVSSNLGHPPIIYKGDILIGGDWSMYSFDLITGGLNWRKEIPDNEPFGIWETTGHILVGDRLFINPTGHEIFCINPSTGESIWENFDDASNCTDNMIYYNDMLVFTSWGKGSVMVLDALDGKLIHREHGFDNSSYNNDVVYDPDTDMFFTATFKHAIGFKINKPD